MMVLKIIYNIIKRLKFRIFNSDPICKHGIGFYNNSLIDTLFPQFVEIGDFFISAPGSVILAHDASPLYFSGKYRVQKTKIGNKVFLGANSVVLPGVTIGDNVIIGACTIVTRDVPSNSVVIGNPGRVVGAPNEYCDKCSRNKILYSPTNDISKSLIKGDMISQRQIQLLRIHIYNQFNEKI